MIDPTISFILFLFFMGGGLWFFNYEKTKLRWWFIYLIIILTIFVITIYPKKIVFDSNANFNDNIDKIRIYLDRDGFISSQYEVIKSVVKEKEEDIEFWKENFPKADEYFKHDEFFYKYSTPVEIKAQKLRDKADYIEMVEFSKNELEKKKEKLEEMNELMKLFKIKYKY